MGEEQTAGSKKKADFPVFRLFFGYSISSSVYIRIICNAQFPDRLQNAWNIWRSDAGCIISSDRFYSEEDVSEGNTYAGTV